MEYMYKSLLFSKVTLCFTFKKVSQFWSSQILMLIFNSTFYFIWCKTKKKEKSALCPSGRQHQTRRSCKQLCYSSRASLLLLVSEDNSLKSGTAIESELASCQPQQLLLQSKEGARDAEGEQECECLHITCMHMYSHANRQLKLSSKCKDRPNGYSKHTHTHALKIESKCGSQKQR